MKKVICKVEYDTESSELILKKTSGVPGDPAGYEESLYKTADGKLFLYVNGGPESPFVVPPVRSLTDTGGIAIIRPYGLFGLFIIFLEGYL